MIKDKHNKRQSQRVASETHHNSLLQGAGNGEENPTHSKSQFELKPCPDSKLESIEMDNRIQTQDGYNTKSKAKDL